MAEEVNDWQPVGDNWKPPKEPDDWQPVGDNWKLPQEPDDRQPAGQQEPGFFSRYPSLAGGEMVRNIADAFGQGFHEGFGEEKLGLRENDLKWLREHEWFRNPGQRGFDSWKAPFQATTELFMNSVWDAGDLALRTLSGFGRGVGEAVTAATGSRDLGSIAAFEPFMGSPHPTGIPKTLPPPKEFVRQTPIKPIEGSPNPGISRVQAAQTGLPEVDRVLNDPVTSHVIENVVVDRSHTVPYTAGGSTPLENPTMYIDRRFPTEFTVRSLSDSKKTVTFDPAEPFSIHENVEQHVMEQLIKGGMEHEEAYRVAHFSFAEPAERAWYRSHDIDQMAAEAAYKPHMDRIQKGKADAVPPDLYKDPYPHDTPSAAKHEALTEPGPTPEEMQRALEILQRTNREGPMRVTTVQGVKLNVSASKEVPAAANVNVDEVKVKQLGDEIKAITERALNEDRDFTKAEMDRIKELEKQENIARTGREHPQLFADEEPPPEEPPDAYDRAVEVQQRRRFGVVEGGADRPRADYIDRIADMSAPLPTVADLDAAIKATKDADREHSRSLGLTDKEIDRIASLNRRIDEGGVGADKAIREKDEILKKVPADAPEPNISDEGSLRQLRREFQSLERSGFGETPAEHMDGISRVLKRYISDVMDGDPFARAVFRKAMDEAQKAGFDTRQITNDTMRRLFGDLSESDQAFMRREFERFMRPAAPERPMLQEARELGVIGPEKPPISEGTPAEAAAREAGSGGPPEPPKGGAGGGGGREPPAGGPPAGAETSPWEKRWQQFTGKINADTDVIENIRAAARENENFPAAREGEIPLGQQDAIGRAAGVEPGTVDWTGVGRKLQNDTQVRLAMQAMMDAAEAVKAAARDVKADPSPQNLMKLQEAMLRRNFTVEQIVGLRAEWGRTGNVFQEFLRDVKDQETLSDFLRDRGTTADDLRDIANGIDALDRESAARVLSDMNKKRPGFFFWTWVNGLISGLLTHTKYVNANAFFLEMEHNTVTPIAAMIGKVKELAGADMDRVFFGEQAAANWGIISAVPSAFVTAAKSVYSGQRAVLKSELELHRLAVERGEKVPPVIDRAVNQVSGIGRPAIFDGSDVWGKLKAGDFLGASKDAAGRTLGAPGDAAMAIHTFFKVLGERASLNRLAYREAIKASEVDASPLMDRFNELRSNPTEGMLNQARADAYKGTFMQELGPWGKKWQNFTKTQKGVRWFFPFSHIPINLMKATYEHTPFAFLDSTMRDDILGKNGGVAQDTAIARMVVGSSIMAYFTNLYMNGQATGSYPLDPKERDNWKLTGKQPDSILINGYWVSYNKFGPAGDLAAIGANIGHLVHHAWQGWRDDDDAMMLQATTQAAYAAARLVSDEVGFQTLANLFESIHDDKKLQSFVAYQAATALPFSSLIRQTASGGLPFTGGMGGDPYMRQVKSFTDALKYTIPGMRGTLPPKRDFLGEPVENPQYGNILRQSRAVDDPVRLEMDRLAIHPAPPQDRIGGVKLTPELYDEYQIRAGGMARVTLENWVNQPGWDQLPAGVRDNIFRMSLRQAHGAAGAIMQALHQEIIAQGVDNRARQIQGEKPGKLQERQ